jgi:hypothetical protein
MQTLETNTLQSPPPFSLQPTHFAERCLACCRRILSQIQSIKESLLDEFMHALKGRKHLLELAVNEAEALAYETDYPALVFPELAAEKVQAVAEWHQRQQRLRLQTVGLGAP